MSAATPKRKTAPFIMRVPVPLDYEVRLFAAERGIPVAQVYQDGARLLMAAHARLTDPPPDPSTGGEDT